MSKQLNISESVKIDPMKLVDSRMLINANSGGGKSWLIRVIAEQAAGMVQTIILDHEGEFSTLREKFDFLLAGPGGEIPAEVRSSNLLARKLLELQASAVVDMSAMKLPERRKFVRLFIESLMAAPKNLWHPLFLVLDEAHIYCPERSSGDAESGSAVIDLMSMGRKRSFCGILATQRLSKLHKDAEAEANNVFIGRTWLDIDQKRACSLLGFGKEYHQTLRDMPAGQFFAFGPALSVQGVSEIQVARCVTTHPRPGHRHNFSPPKPSDAVKRIVSELADLPQQAEAEIRNLDDAKKRINELQRQVNAKPVPAAAAPPKVDMKAERDKWFQDGWHKGSLEERKHLSKVLSDLTKQGKTHSKSIVDKLESLKSAASMNLSLIDSIAGMLASGVTPPVATSTHTPSPPIRHVPLAPKPDAGSIPANPDLMDVDRAGQRVLNSLCWWKSARIEEPTREQVAFVAGYTVNGHFNNTLGKLKTAGFIDYPGGGSVKLITNPFPAAEYEELTFDVMVHKVRAVLKENALDRVFTALLDILNNLGSLSLSVSVDSVAEKAGYTVNGHFNNCKGKLNTLGVIRYPSKGSIGLGDMFKPFL